MEPEKKTGFDATKPFVVPILSGGEKSCEVRFPTDEEWCAWARAQRTVRHFLGRGKSHSEDVDLPKINAELFAKIRTDKDGPEFDDAGEQLQGFGINSPWLGCLGHDRSV